MKRIYQETISERKDHRKIIEAHVVDYKYDTEDIKEECCICGRKIESSEERYRKRGNYCEKCNAGNIKNRHKSIKNL